MAFARQDVRLEVEQLSFTYPAGVEALREVSLSIQSGERVAIIGQNGSGKTTLVRHFNGLLRPTRGRVLVGDWDTAAQSVAKLAARVGYVFQNPDDQLFCRNVQEEVAFGPANLGLAGECLQERVRDALKLTGLAGKEGTNPYDLSATWRKMVALASILAMDTPIVVFDEPTTGQDAASVERIANIVEELGRRGKTVITITHDIDFCAENFSRVIAMKEGRILLDGSTRRVLAQEELLATTYVEPPQLARLGRRLGFPETVCTQDEFFEAYRSWRPGA